MVAFSLAEFSTQPYQVIFYDGQSWEPQPNSTKLNDLNEAQVCLFLQSFSYCMMCNKKNAKINILKNCQKMWFVVAFLLHCFLTGDWDTICKTLRSTVSSIKFNYLLRQKTKQQCWIIFCIMEQCPIIDSPNQKTVMFNSDENPLAANQLHHLKQAISQILLPGF